MRRGAHLRALARAYDTRPMQMSQAECDALPTPAPSPEYAAAQAGFDHYSRGLTASLARTDDLLAEMKAQHEADADFITRWNGMTVREASQFWRNRCAMTLGESA